MRMPWWAIIYLVVFAGLCVAAVWDDDRDGRSMPFLLCSVLAHSTIVYLFIAFWQPALVGPFGIVLATAFVLAIGWHVFQTVADL
jgi:cytochrome bd-type quinol oxidase subunit 2